MTASNVNMRKWPYRTPQNVCMYDLYQSTQNIQIWLLTVLMSLAHQATSLGKKSKSIDSLIHTHSHVHTDSLVTQLTPERHQHWQLRDTPEGRKVKQKTKKPHNCSHKQERGHLIHSHLYFHLNKQHILKNPKVMSCMAGRKPYFLILVKFKDKIITPLWNTQRFCQKDDEDVLSSSHYSPDSERIHFSCTSFTLVSFSLV